MRALAAAPKTPMKEDSRIDSSIISRSWQGKTLVGESNCARVVAAVNAAFHRLLKTPMITMLDSKTRLFTDDDCTSPLSVVVLSVTSSGVVVMATNLDD